MPFSHYVRRFWMKPPKFDSAADLQIEEQSLENTFVKLAFNPNGTFNLTDKATGRQFENCHFFLDESDAGDEYNYYAVPHDVPRTTLDVEAVRFEKSSDSLFCLYGCGNCVEPPR